MRISKGVYAVRALMGALPYESIGGQKAANPPKAASQDAKPSRPTTPALPSNAEQEIESLPKVGHDENMQAFASSIACSSPLQMIYRHARLHLRACKPCQFAPYGKILAAG